MAMRPKKPRTLDGVQLADNLYPDPRKRPGYYQYKLPNKRILIFKAASPVDANEISAEALEAYHAGVTADVDSPTREHLAFHVGRYITYIEKHNPKLKEKSQWANDCYALKKFAREFTRLAIITHEVIQTWWDDLTYHQQKQRHTSFRKFFTWMIREELVPRLKYNPFTLDDSGARLLRKEVPDKKRPPLSQLQYRLIRKTAGELDYECLQLAMGIRLYTTMREGDVCMLKFKENIVGGELRRVIGKSEAMHGAHGAARRSWNLEKHPKLKALLDRARELALINKGCPFVLSHPPKRRAWNADKEHLSQVTGEPLYRMFIEARDRAGIKGVTFHEVRGLSSTLYRLAGYTDKQIQHLMAHEDVETTKGYQNPDELPFEEITMKLEVEL